MDNDCINRGFGAAEVLLIKKFIHQELGDTYTTMAVANTSPIQHGYAAEKSRTVVVGGRSDQVDENQLRGNFWELIQNTLPLAHNYWTFLGLDKIADEIADAVGQLSSLWEAYKIH